MHGAVGRAGRHRWRAGPRFVRRSGLEERRFSLSTSTFPSPSAVGGRYARRRRDGRQTLISRRRPTHRGSAGAPLAVAPINEHDLRSGGSTR